MSKDDNTRIIEVSFSSMSPHIMEIKVNTNGSSVIGEGFAKKMSLAIGKIMEDHEEEVSSKPDGSNENNLLDVADRMFETAMRGMFSHSKEEAQHACMDFLRILAQEGRLTEDEFGLFCNANNFETKKEARKAFNKLMNANSKCECKGVTSLGVGEEGELVCSDCSKVKGVDKINNN